MTRSELAQSVAREFISRFGPANSEPWRGGVRASVPVFKRYEAELPRHQRYRGPTREDPSLLAGGLPLYASPSSEATTGGHDADPSTIFQQLEEAARAEDIPTFVRLADQIDWHRMSADQLAQAIHHALWIQAHILAHRLAALGGQLHPSHPELAKMARILAPPKFLGWDKADPEDVAGWNADREWLNREGPSYPGEWVALWRGSLLGHSPNAKDLHAIVKSRPGVLFTKIW